MRHYATASALEQPSGCGVTEMGEVDAIRMVMSIMGHTSAATSRRCVELAVEVLRDAIK